jgi:hypothetical protein
LIGCGGGSETETVSSRTGPSPAVTRADVERYVAEAEPICRQSVSETEVLGERLPQAASHSETLQETVARGLVRPGITILSRKASRLRDLKPTPESENLRVYLGLFDPIVELSRQLLQVSESGDAGRGHELELMIADLGSEQSAAARRFGFRACSVEFTDALGGTG